MALYSLSVETTSNSTAAATAGTGCAIQMLMPASRAARLVGVLVKPQQLTNTQQSGRWVVDRISAVTTGSSMTPLKMDAYAVASAITDTTKTISTTVVGANTAVDSAIMELVDGWNWMKDLNITSGNNQGFAIRRATAPTGAQVVGIVMIWEEI